MKAPTKKVTQSQLAKALGISRQLIAWHMKTGKAPKLSDPDGWLEYLAAHGREGSLPPEQRKKIAVQRLRLISAQAERVEIENGVRRSETIEFESARAFTEKLTKVLFFGELDRLANEFPTTLKGKTELGIHEEVLRQIEQVKSNLEVALENWKAANGKQATGNNPSLGG